MRIPLGVRALLIVVAAIAAVLATRPSPGCAAPALLLAGALALLARAAPHAWFLATSLALLAAGSTVIALVPAPLLGESPAGLLRIRGTVTASAAPIAGRAGCRFTLCDDGGRSFDIRLAGAGRLPLRGERWRVVGRILHRRVLRNFGASAEPRPRFQPLLLSTPALAVRREGGAPLQAYLEHLRQMLRRRLTVAFSPRWQPFAAALLLGRARELGRGDRAALRHTGTAHLVAVSGLHLGLFLLAPLWLTRRWPRRRRGITLLALILIYGLLTGARAPIRRAVMLWAAFIGCDLLDRPHNTWNALGWAATLELLWRPLVIREVSFLLSYAAVAGILSVAARGSFAARLPLLAGTLRALRIGAAATLATLPILHSVFGRFSAHTIWLSPIAAALLATAMIPGYLALALGSPLLATPVEFLFALVLGLLERADALPGTPTDLAGVPILCSTLVAVGCWLALRGRWRVALGALALGAVAAIAPPVLRVARSDPEEPDFFVEVLDVAHGTCVLLGAPGGPFALFDSGSASAPRTAARALSARLHHYGVGEFELLLYSHGDADHRNLPPLVEDFPPARATLAATSFAGSGLHLWEGRVTLHLGPAQLEVSTAAMPPTAPANEHSLALVIRLPGQTLLLFGDQGWAALAEQIEGLPRCDLLLWPHHGRDHEGARALFAHCRPATVWVSDDIPHRIPHVRARILSTADHGALRWCWRRDGSSWIESAAGERFDQRLSGGRRSNTRTPAGGARAAGRLPRGSARR